MKKYYSFLFILGFLISSVFAQVEFKSFDLNNNNKLLFSIEHTPVVESAYETLFYYNVDQNIQQGSSSKNNNPYIMTCYPEQIEVLSDGKIFQFRNRYGTAQYGVNSKKLRYVKRATEIENSSTSFIPVYHERLAPISVSPDGKFVGYIERTTAARGKLIIRCLENNQAFVLADKVEYGYDQLPIKWSPVSSTAIYENSGMLYFITLKDGAFENPLPEKYRKIGPGTIRNVYWASGKKLMYVDHELVYAISADELYTRALYSELIGNGKIVGRLPSVFNSSEDQFWTSESGLSLVLLQDNRTLWYMELAGTDFNFVTTLFSYPFVTVPGTALNFKVFWTLPKRNSIKQTPLVWLEMLRDGKSESYLYSLVRKDSENYAYFVSLPIPTFSRIPKLSPDKSQLAFAGDDAFYVYDVSSWTQKFCFNEERITNFAWIDNESIVLGGNETVRTWSLVSNTSSILFLSQAPVYGWNGESDEVLAKNSFGTFQYDKNLGTWKTASNTIMRENSTRNSKWRIFLDKSQNASYKNTIYCRELNAESYNRPLFDQTARKIVHDKPMVALTFDCLDNADGITSVLSSLSRYGIKSTFFINGEFVRRFPTGVNEIIKAGHQCGSMFYSPYFMSDDGFDMNENFIRRGLARNEDDFYELTQHELSLLWHMPNYYSNNIILKAGSDAGYTWIDKGLAPLDMLTYEQVLKSGEKYYTSSQLIDYIVDNLENGAVIPISVGISEGTRGDYLYDKLDVLISAILAKGYQIVTVSELLQGN